MEGEIELNKNTIGIMICIIVSLYDILLECNWYVDNFIFWGDAAKSQHVM